MFISYLLTSLHPLTLLCQGLEFQDLCVDIGSKRILWDVHGQAGAGSVLALMGPSGG